MCVCACVTDFVLTLQALQHAAVTRMINGVTSQRRRCRQLVRAPALPKQGISNTLHQMVFSGSPHVTQFSPSSCQGEHSAVGNPVEFCHVDMIRHTQAPLRWRPASKVSSKNLKRWRGQR